MIDFSGTLQAIIAHSAVQSFTQTLIKMVLCLDRPNGA